MVTMELESIKVKAVYYNERSLWTLKNRINNSQVSIVKLLYVMFRDLLVCVGIVTVRFVRVFFNGDGVRNEVFEEFRPVSANGDRVTFIVSA